MSIKLQFSPLVIETFARLDGVLAFLKTMDDGFPAAEEKQRRYLEQFATRAGWEYDDYTAERDILEQNFHTWIPMFAAYSATALLYSIVETQLHTFAEHMGKNRGSKLRVRDMAGKGIERSALYLERGVSFELKSDLAWSRLADLQWLRNVIVHRGGKPGEAQDQQMQVNALIKKYPALLELRDTDGFHKQIWLSTNLCRDFAQDIDGFFERIFKASGLPNRHGVLVTPASSQT